MPFGSVALTGEMWWEIFKNLVGMRQGMWQLGGDFQGISWGLPGDFISYGGISSKILSVLLGFRGDFGETTYPYYNTIGEQHIQHMPICPK